MAEPLGYQLTIDCADPAGLAAFWAEALGFEPDSRHTGQDGRYAAIRDPRHRPGGRIVFQRVPEPKTGKNRAHLDVLCGGERRAEQVARLVALGATVLGEVDEAAGRWTVLADPEGNEFCVG